MEIKNLLISACFLLLLPTWIGCIWTYFIKSENKLKDVLLAWFTGFMTMMAASQIILVPLVLRRYGFEYYRSIGTVVIVLLCIASLLVNGIRFRSWIQTGKNKEKHHFSITKNWWISLLFAGVAVMIFAQAYLAADYQHLDEDDSRFVAEEVIAIEQGSMYTKSPVDGSIIYWDLGEMKKDMTSPWTMMVAFICYVSGIAPAVMSHVYLPFFLILLCYAVYFLMADNLFKKDKEKTAIFLFFISTLNIFGYSSTHTTPAMLLLRIWQGKAMVAGLMIPAILYVMYEIMSTPEKKSWYFMGAVTATAAALTSGIGIITIPAVIAICGLANLIHTRKIGTTIKMWCTAVPSGVYLLCYVFFWQLLKTYY